MMLTMSDLASADLEDFHVRILALKLHDWQSMEITFRVRHKPSRTATNYIRHIPKDDYLLRRDEISGSRTDFVERDATSIAKSLAAHLRLKKLRGKNYGSVTICVEEIEICNWDPSTKSFLERAS